MGRPENPVWDHFVKVKTGKNVTAKCKYCHTERKGEVGRLSKHLLKCKEYLEYTNTQSSSLPALAHKQPEGKQAKISTRKDGEIVETSTRYKNELDLQVAKFFYASNTPFQRAEHREFKKLCEMLRPGYIPPDRKSLADVLLEPVHDDIMLSCQENFRHQTVTMALDGWSNVHGEPIVCSSIVNKDGQYALVESVDTSGNAHSSDYLTELARNCIKMAEEQFKVRVASFVTDNAANVTKMRKSLNEDETLDLIHYGCSAHLLNLFSSDIEMKTARTKVIKIIKHFRSKHLPAAWFKTAGGKELVLPIEVRWNTLSDAIMSYLENRGVLIKVCDSHRNEIDKDIVKLVNDMNLAHQLENYMKILKPISVALDRAQRGNTNIAIAVEIWFKLERDLEGQATNIMSKFTDRRDMALGPPHFLANLMDHRFLGARLTENQRSQAFEYLKEIEPGMLPILLSHANGAGHSLFSDYLYEPSFCKIDPMTWWNAVTVKDLKGAQLEWDSHKSLWMRTCEQLLTANATTAGLERIFSTFGLVQSKLRNRLGNKKASKLTFIFKWLNQRTEKKKNGIEWVWDQELVSSAIDIDQDSDEELAEVVNLTESENSEEDESGNDDSFPRSSTELRRGIKRKCRTWTPAESDDELYN